MEEKAIQLGLYRLARPVSAGLAAFADIEISTRAVDLLRPLRLTAPRLRTPEPVQRIRDQVAGPNLKPRQPPTRNDIATRRFLGGRVPETTRMDAPADGTPEIDHGPSPSTT